MRSCWAACALADAGSTVVFTTHVVQDLEYCHQVIFLASGGTWRSWGRSMKRALISHDRKVGKASSRSETGTSNDAVAIIQTATGRALAEADRFEWLYDLQQPPSSRSTGRRLGFVRLRVASAA